MAYKGVFFDLGGTLLAYGDMKAAWADWFSALHDALGKRVAGLTRERLSGLCEGFFSRPAPSPDEDGLTAFERRVKRLCSEMGVSTDAESARSAAAACLDAWQKYMTPDPESHGVLAALHGRYTLALISNFDHPPYIRAQLEKYGWADMFESVVISGEVGVAKPDPRIFSIALDQTGLSPEEVIYLGDAVEDAEGAIAAAVTPVIIRRKGIGEYGGRIVTDYTSQDDRAGGAVSDSPFKGARIISRLPEFLDIVFSA